MIVIPAIDLRDGDCVQLRGGDFDQELIRLSDPVHVAVQWRDLGFRHLHVIDLDAAAGTGSNRVIIERICEFYDVTAQVGGGVRDTGAVDQLLRLGASSVLVGTRAFDDPAWFAEVANANPGRIALALDVRGGTVTTSAWREQTTIDPAAFLASVASLPLAQVVATAVDVEGQEAGPDLDLVRTLRAATAHRLGVAGGVTTAQDVAALAALGVDSVVVGTALYTGKLEMSALSEELHP
jgi:phosphoribosylformimino-5-aminoimidazole carboxamide ribotide isomerase